MSYKSQVEIERDKFDARQKRPEITREQLQVKIKEDIEQGKQKTL